MFTLNGVSCERPGISSVLRVAILLMVFVIVNACDASGRVPSATPVAGDDMRSRTPTQTVTPGLTQAFITAIPSQGRSLVTPTRGARPEPELTVVTVPPSDHRSAPLPTRQAQFGSEVKTVEYDCGPTTDLSHVHPSVAQYGVGLLAWPSGGAGILFDYDGAIWSADDATGEIDYLLESNPDPYSSQVLEFGYYADISRAGDKVVYTTCEFPQDVEAGGGYPAVAHEQGPPSANYDIVIGEIDNDGRDGITSNTRITNTPE